MGAITRGFANRVKAGGGGSKVLLNTTTVSSDVSAVNFDNTLVTSAFNTYCILIEYIETDNGSGNAGQLKLSTDNGSSFVSQIDQVSTRDRNTDIGALEGRQNQSDITVFSGLQVSGGSVGSTEIMIYNPEASSRHTMVTIHGANDVHGHGDNVRMMTGAAHNNENSAVNYFRITFDNGNISSALIKLYGVQ